MSAVALMLRNTCRVVKILRKGTKSNLVSMKFLFLLENSESYNKFVKYPWHYLQLVIMQGFLPIILNICLFMDTQISWWFKPQTVDLLEGVDCSDVRWILFPSLSLSE